MKFRIARSAERDLQEIGDWIAKRDPDAAARFTAELEAKARQIAISHTPFPLSARRREVAFASGAIVDTSSITASAGRL